MRTSAQNPRHRGDVEGLRAVAVLTVLGFHAAVPYFRGGYVGVDVFFVISGFLITGLLLKDITKSGRFSLKEFYARRARRILPAAGVVLLAISLGSWLLLPPLRAKDVAYDVLAAALNVANWRFVANHTDYLAAQRDHSPVLHFWSLGVEEQFYLVWAPMLLLLALLAKKLGRSALPLIAAFIGTLTVGSFLLSLQWTSTSGPLAYMGSPSRAWEFGLGALAALIAPVVHSKVNAGLLWVVGWLGAAAIVWSTIAFGSATPFPGTAALAPVVGAVAVILGLHKGRGSVSAVLSLRPMRAVGRLSYSWYLWHWPVLVFAEAAWGQPAWPLKLALVIGSAVPAMVTLRLVERPVRFSATISAMPVRGLAIGATAVMLPLAGGLVLGSNAQRVMNTDVTGLSVALPLGATEGPDLLTGAAAKLTPPVDRARGDVPPVPGCELFPAETSGPPCVFGDPARERVLLIGDSHASQWFPAVQHLAERRNWSVQVQVKQGCPLPELAVHNPTLGRGYTECDTWRKQTLDRIAAGPKPRLIFVASLNRYTQDQQALKSAWDKTLDRLAVTGAPIVYLRDTPVPGKDIPACVSSTLAECSFPRQSALQPDPLAQAVTKRERFNVSTVDVNEVLCTTDTCPAVLQGVLLYRDDSHLTNTAASVLGQRVEKTLEQQGVLAPLEVFTARSTEWKKIWREDFAGPAGARPAELNWLYATGTCYPGCPANQWGTGEVETMTDSADNVRLDGQGRLAITPVFKDGKWTSGRIETRRTDFRVPKQGVLRVEASLQLPDVNSANGAGYWPAFWMLGDSIRSANSGWPGAGEIDIMESVNGREAVFSTLHCGVASAGPCDEPRGLGTGEQACPGCQKAFHTYAVEISQSHIRWYIDGKQTFEVSASRVGEQAWRQATDHGFFLILNVAVGGGLPGGPNAATISGKPMLVDSVSVSVRGG